ncbi:MAG: hypothetical protein ACXAB7_20560 [Candidatus Kariarchaeaceae archaeon]|jgi:hypothetical protein
MSNDQFSLQIVEPLSKFLETLSRISPNNRIFLETKPAKEDLLALQINENATMRDFILEMCYQMVISGFSNVYECFSFIVEFIEQFRPTYLEASKDELVDLIQKGENVDEFMSYSLTRIKKEMTQSLRTSDQQN